MTVGLTIAAVEMKAGVVLFVVTLQIGSREDRPSHLLCSCRHTHTLHSLSLYWAFPQFLSDSSVYKGAVCVA